ncbi:MAG: TrmH family RNA methyltransferase, partial [Desulfocucumaceae bacterium]
MEPIRSIQNPLVKQLAKLKKRRFREQEGKFIVEGARFVEEALGSGWPVESLIHSPELLNSGRGPRLLAVAAGRGIKTVLVDKNVIEALAYTEAPQGILAICGMRLPRLEEMAGQKDAMPGKNSLVVVMDGVSDPGNLGTIIRSAHAFGADGAVLMRGTVDLYNDKALRSTMGSVFYLPVAQNVSPAELREYLEGQGVSLLVGVPEGGSPPEGLDLSRPLALVVGSEASGPSADILLLPHQKVTLPMPGRADSLNAAVAASIMMYEITRLR